LTYCLASDTVRGPGPADTSPRALWIYLARGYAEGRQGHYRKAKADFARAEALLQKRPNLRASYALLNNRAVTLLAAQEFDAAQADLQRAIALRPEQFHPYLSLAEIRVRRQDLVGALRYLDRGVAAAEALRARREVDDDTLARLYRRRHGVHLQCRHHGDALADLERVCALPLPPAGRALGHRERGQLLAHLGRHADALAAYDASLAARPEAETYRWRGELLLTLKRYPEAARSFDAYLRAGGEPTAFVYQARARARARARLKADDPAGAVADATHALEMGDPDGGSAAVGLRLLRGQAHLAGHAYPLAVRDFEEVLARQAEDEARGTAYLGRGLARFRLGRVAEAAADAEEAVKHAPANRRVVYAASASSRMTSPRPRPTSARTSGHSASSIWTASGTPSRAGWTTGTRTPATTRARPAQREGTRGGPPLPRPAARPRRPPSPPPSRP
jgi:tetratricopeptide (TPR) repeat protein